MCRGAALAILLLAAGARAGADMIPASAFAPGATVVDFEGQATTGLPVVPGMTFVIEGSPIAAPWYEGSTSFDTAMFGGAHMGNHVSITYSDLGVAFASPMEGAGAWVSQVPNFTATFPPTLTVVALDALGAVVDQVVVALPAVDAEPIFVGFGSAAGIARLEWRVGDLGFFGVDDITFGALRPIPEPATLALTGVGLGLLSLRRRTHSTT